MSLSGTVPLMHPSLALFFLKTSSGSSTFRSLLHQPQKTTTPRCRGLLRYLAAAGNGIVLVDRIPVDDMPPLRDVLWAPVLILQVVRLWQGKQHSQLMRMATPKQAAELAGVGRFRHPGASCAASTLGRRHKTARTCSQTSRPRMGIWLSSTMPTCTMTGQRRSRLTSCSLVPDRAPGSVLLPASSARLHVQRLLY